MNESQNIEWKESWRDEYLKWICGFANATGGRIYIGMNDNDKVVGVADADKLLEDIPNKVRDVLGIIVDVNLLEENGLKYIEIDVPPYSNPINYKGQYHYRSGRKGCSSGRRASSNHASSGHWTADEIQHHGRSGFPAFCRTDAERRTGSHRSHKRGRKRCDPGSTDPGGRRSGSSPENQGFQEKTGRRNHRVRP